MKVGRPRKLKAEPSSSQAPQLAAFEERRLALARAAFEIIARDGFESLRTRDVASRVGVNIATLHYYFATKEKLIEGVALYLATLFQSIRAPTGGASNPSAAERLEQEFADARLYFDQQPEMIAVMQELVLRGRRDPVVAQIVGRLKHFWKASVEETIAMGAKEGVFRTDLSPQAASAVVVAAVWGAATLPLESAEREHVYRAMRQWLAAPSNPTQTEESHGSV